MAFTWWQRWGKAGRDARRRARIPLKLETLEGRLAPAGLTFTWTSEGDHVHWSDTFNWRDQNNNHALPGAGDALIFPTLAPGEISRLDDDIDIVDQNGNPGPLASIEFDDQWDIFDHTFSLVNGITTKNAAGTTVTCECQVTFTSSQTFTVTNAGATLLLTTFLNLEDPFSQNPQSHTLTAAGAGNLKINGDISDVSSNPSKVVKNGTGTLTLSGNNTFAGGVTLNTGTLAVSSNTAPGTGPLTLNGGVLQSTTNITLNNPFTVGAPAMVAGGNNLTLRGAGTLNSVLSVANMANIITLAGQLNGNGGLSENGPGVLQISGNVANTYTGLTTVFGGTLQLNKTPGFDAVSGPLTIGATTPGAPTGVLRLLASNQIPDTTVVAIQRFGLFDLFGNAETVAGLNMTGGRVDSGAGTASVLGNVTAISDVAGGTATITGNLFLGAGAGTFVVNDGPGTNDLTVDATISGSRPLTKTATGTLVLLRDNTYTGGTTVSGGVLQLDGKQPQSNVSVLTGATFQGNGTTGAITVTGGTLRPGDGAAGILTSTQSVTLDATSKFTVFLAGSRPGMDYSQLQSTGPQNLGGSTINVIMPPGFTPAPGQMFTTNSGSQINGSFAQAQVGNSNAQFDGNTIVAGPVRIGVDYDLFHVILIPNYTVNARYVDELYHDLLNRIVDSNGLVTWTNQLDAGTPVFNVIFPIVTSGESRDLEVQTLYAQFLHRSVDPNGKATFTAFLAAGGTLEDVAAKLAGSPEYAQSRGTTDDAFLNVLYKDSFNRPVDPLGLAHWKQQLNGGQTREQVARAILTSGEHRAALVKGFYQQFLRRAADPGGVGFWSGFLQQTTDQVVIANFVQTKEYRDNRPLLPTTINAADPRFLNNVAQDLLGGAVDQGALATLLQNSLNRIQLAAQFTNGQPYRTLVVSSLYQQYLHRLVDPQGLSVFTDLLARGGTDEQVADLLAGSGEYFQARGLGTDAGFVNALFQDALNRPPTGTELATFLQDLQTMSRQQVADLILGSPNDPPQNTPLHTEYLRAVVTSIFQKYLKRMPDSSGLQHFTDLLQNGMTDEAVIAQVVGSTEYFNRP